MSTHRIVVFLLSFVITSFLKICCGLPLLSSIVRFYSLCCILRSQELTHLKYTRGHNFITHHAFGAFQPFGMFSPYLSFLLITKSTQYVHLQPLSCISINTVLKPIYFVIANPHLTLVVVRKQPSQSRKSVSRWYSGYG